MLRAQITPLTLYNIDNTIFDGIELPKRPFTDRGYTDLFLTGWDMDKPTFINNLLLETAELNVLYTNPDFFKFAVTQWAAKEKTVWQSLYETIFFKYNPIWNKDGTIKHETTETRDLMNGATITGTTGGTLTDSTTENKTIEQDETIERDENSQRDYTEQMRGTVTETETPQVEDTQTVTYNTNENKDYLTTHGGTVVTDKTESGSQNELSEDNWTEGTETKVAAFDSTTYQNRDKTDTTHAGTGEKNTIHSTTGRDTVTDTSTVHDEGDLAKTGTETTVVGHDGSNVKETEYNTDKTITDDLTQHNDDTTRHFEQEDNLTGTKTQSTTGTESRTQSGTDEGTIETESTVVEQGNIGVVTTQAMIAAERELVKFNIYDVIIESFKQRFCLLIY